MATEQKSVDFDFTALDGRVLEWLREYIRIDTTNPPGDVSLAADWVEGVLQAAGVATTRIGPSPAKANVVATIGEGDPSRSLVLAHHMDVVPAVSDDWSVPPFSGDLRDDFVWGRGTLDMKAFGVMTMVCAVALKEAGVPLARPLRILATADEEVGGIDGARWLAENRLEDVCGEFLLTEGSFARAGPRTTYYAVQVAEKGVTTARLTARGQPGHASAPREDNAVVRLARAVGRLGDYRSPPAALDLARRYLAAFPPSALRLPDGATIEGLTDSEMEALLHDLSGGARIQHMLRNTFSPTMINAGQGQNVIPAKAEAYVDCRLVPGVTLDDLRQELTQVIDDAAIEIEFVKASVGTESSSEGELFGAIREAVAAERPAAIVVPYLTSGGTDCKHFRPRGITCYGHIPFELDDKELERIHGIDERVSLANLQLGLRVLMRIVLNVCVAPGTS
jgi:acetylornithine deacetylase/succinyl-diaminopimelate desuccinylase-like protein